MCAVSNEKQFICILNHPGTGSRYFILYIFPKDQAAQAEALCLQNWAYPPPFPPYVTAGEQERVPEPRTGLSEEGHRAVRKLPAATPEAPDGLSPLGLAAFSPTRSRRPRDVGAVLAGWILFACISSPGLRRFGSLSAF